MFENISKGEFETRGRFILKDGDTFLSTIKEMDARFISFCFNLQQRYDISKLEEAVRTLDEIKSICDGNITNENNIWHKCNNVLKRQEFINSKTK